MNWKKYLVILLILVLGIGYAYRLMSPVNNGLEDDLIKNKEEREEAVDSGKNSWDSDYEMAIFAGGCFWCMEPPFEKLEGVKEVVSGYTGGHVENPTYKQVASGSTGHVEAVKVLYDPDKISYEELLDVFWRQINPTDDEGQFVDRGFQYTTGIFYYDEEQRVIAEKSKEDMDKSNIFKKPIVTIIKAVAEFYEAEEYHQDYYKKNPVRYKFYRGNSGRDKYLESIWKDNIDK